MYYLRGLVNFNDDMGFLSFIANQTSQARPQKQPEIHSMRSKNSLLNTQIANTPLTLFLHEISGECFGAK